MVLITARDSAGRVIGRCDERCYDAKNYQCDCVCNGRNHKKGQDRAIENTRKMADRWKREYSDRMGLDDLSWEVPVYQLSLF